MRAARFWLIARGLVGLLLAAPPAWAVWASFQPVDHLFTLRLPDPAGRLPADHAVWENYRRVLVELPLARFLMNSIFLAIVTTVGTVFSASLAGFAFSRFEWPGRRFCFVLLLATMMIPGQALLIPQFLIFQQLGWVNTYKPLIVPAWLGGSAFFILLFYQFFRGIPRAYEDAARIDGASSWQVYRYVVLPMSRPVIGAVAALCAVHHWHEFLVPLVYLSDYTTYPVSVGLRMFHSLQSSRPDLIMAASVVSLIPPLIIVFLAQRYLMKRLHGRGGG